MTIEDEEGDLARRLDTAYQVIGKVAHDRGVVVIQVHPDVRTAKLAFEKRVIGDWRGRAWFATLSEFGDWWLARDAAQIDVTDDAGGWRLAVSGAKPVERLRIVLPKARLAGARAAVGLTPAGQAVEVSRVAGSAALSWRQ